MSIGPSQVNGGYVENDVYVPSDVRADVSGLYLALEQRGNGRERAEWHLHQDFVITLGLKREEERWLSLSEGYCEVARLRRDEKGAPVLLEAKASHLRDYLCARQMALRVASYRHRTEVVENADHVTWSEGGAVQTTETDRWEAEVVPIHEGGARFGAERAVLHVARTDVDPDDDVPVLGAPGTAETTSRFWTAKDPGRKLYRVDARLWRQHWVEPAAHSERVRGDKVPPSVFFIVDAEDRRENRDTLRDGGRWLWFRPEVVCALIKFRGGGLRWWTRDTGEVWCSPGCGVTFGINALGLVSVYAKDIVFLPDWQQRVWAGFNVGPDGKLSEELHAAQVRAEPAETQAPEAHLAMELECLANVAKTKLGIEVVRRRQISGELLESAHRFRATDRQGLYALAKDLARLTVDIIDAKALQTLAPPPKKENWRSLKSLENVLVKKIEPEAARGLMEPLFGIYELRHADAHLVPADEVAQALQKVGVNEDEPFVVQGFELMDACVSAICRIREVLEDDGAGG